MARLNSHSARDHSKEPIMPLCLWDARNISRDPGSENIYPLKLDGHYSSLTGGFTTVQGLAYGRRGRLYVLESMTAPGFPGPDQVGTGIIVRVDRGRTPDHRRSRPQLPLGHYFWPGRKTLCLQLRVRRSPGSRTSRARRCF